MVNTIFRTGGARGSKRATNGNAAHLKKHAGTAKILPAPRGKRMQLSSSLRAIPADVKASPPMQLELVLRIRQAIADGNYLIDLDAITESLFESYLELNN